MTDITRITLDDHMAPVSHYCHVVRVRDHVWLSGTVGARADGSVPDDVVEQFQLAMDNLDQALKAVGGKPEHIVKVNLYLTDINDRPKINPIREAYFGAHRPASTLVEVTALVSPAMKVEIEAEAFITG